MSCRRINGNCVNSTNISSKSKDKMVSGICSEIKVIVGVLL
jgi:hypothetical protein